MRVTAADAARTRDALRRLAPSPPRPDAALSARWRALLGVVTAFTVAHSITLALAGCTTDPPAPNEHPPALLPAVLGAALRQIQLDVTGLEFLNSSGIKALVNWLLLVKQQPVELRYGIVLQYDEGITWQGKGLRPLASVAPTFLRLEPLR